MWIVAKVKIKDLNTFKKNLAEKIGDDIKFYHPKIEYHKYFGDKVKRFEKFILENYIFCYHAKFKKSNSVNEVKFLRGLEYFLEGYKQNQNNIVKFIEYCRTFENEEGYLKPSFFNKMVKDKAQFISGPFTNMMFEIISEQKNKLKILIGNSTAVIERSRYHYQRC